ncbi:hypothetical protein PILCRDRAFT_502530 [Piloderma croceum F 1598]|uniref:Uncharacterized protein n=1 Tax=Piloderma croceum (strain F 1598) TaxID=765440 RepID=A0A0C3FN61_PILCF|nr:hypothetical protein PILCRDRAFT_502530 [Piloderma croceum F 1598]
MAHARSDSVVTLQPGQILPSPLSPVASPTSFHGENSATTRFHGLSTDAAAPPERGQIVSPKRHIKVEAPDESFALANSSRHSSPPRSRLPPCISSPPFSHHRRNYPSSTRPYGKATKINNLSRELWKTRKEISTAKERERRLQKEIERLTGSEMSKLEENESLQERGRRVDIELRMQAVQLKLDLEQDRRAVVEQLLRDVERECRKPFIVPALLKAFIKISQISDAAVDVMNKERLGQ